MKKLVTALFLVLATSAVWAAGVHKAKSAEAQPLVYNWDNGTKGCGLRLIVLTDVPASLHVLNTSLNIFKKDQKYWGTVKGGYLQTARMTDTLVDASGVCWHSQSVR